MNITEVPFGTVDWDAIERTEHRGEFGVALWRTVEIGNLRIRRVTYSAGYLADHWCARGHVLYVLSGELDTELRDGRTISLHAGMSYHVADDEASAHRSKTTLGAELFIVD